MPNSPLAPMQPIEGAETHSDDTYRVVVMRLKNGMTHVSVKRHDGQPIHSWRELQRIKNAILGDEIEAVQIFPAESRLVDVTHTYHLWALPVGEQFGFGFTERRVSDSEWREPVSARVTVRKEPPVEACG